MQRLQRIVPIMLAWLLVPATVGAQQPVTLEFWFEVARETTKLSAAFPLT